MKTVPVVYDLDDNGEATAVHFYCCGECRAQSEHRLPDASNCGTLPATDVIEDTICETCSYALVLD